MFSFGLGKIAVGAAPQEDDLLLCSWKYGWQGHKTTAHSHLSITAFFHLFPRKEIAPGAWGQDTKTEEGCNSANKQFKGGVMSTHIPNEGNLQLAPIKNLGQGR